MILNNLLRAKNFFLATFILFLPLTYSQANEPIHLRKARELIQAALTENNEYATDPSYLGWFWQDGQRTVHLRTVCSTFVTLLLQESYHLDQITIRAWTGSGSPTASAWHDAITQQNGFEKIDNFRNIRVGDFIAINYPNDRNASGHIVIVADLPRSRIATSPVVQGTQQFELSVIDSSSFPHGPEDTRMLPNSVRVGGLGRGTMRFYLDAENRLVGHTWSIFRNSEYRNISSYPIAIGRLLLPE
jgi:hypothetical protein